MSPTKYNYNINHNYASVCVIKNYVRSVIEKTRSLSVMKGYNNNVNRVAFLMRLPCNAL